MKRETSCCTSTATHLFHAGQPLPLLINVSLQGLHHSTSQLEHSMLGGTRLGAISASEQVELKDRQVSWKTRGATEACSLIVIAMVSGASVAN